MIILDDLVAMINLTESSGRQAFGCAFRGFILIILIDVGRSMLIVGRTIPSVWDPGLYKWRAVPRDLSSLPLDYVCKCDSCFTLAPRWWTVPLSYKLPVNPLLS